MENHYKNHPKEYKKIKKPRENDGKKKKETIRETTRP
jgi:hypothetical protein